MLFVLHFLGENDPEKLLPPDSCLLGGLIFLCLETILASCPQSALQTLVAIIHPLIASFLHREISPREEIRDKEITLFPQDPCCPQLQQQGWRETRFNCLKTWGPLKKFQEVQIPTRCQFVLPATSPSASPPQFGGSEASWYPLSLPERAWANNDPLKSVAVVSWAGCQGQ